MTGIVLTKLDGSAKGGIVVAVQRELGVPVKLVGLGEGADDLAPFDPETFVDALLGCAAPPSRHKRTTSPAESAETHHVSADSANFLRALLPTRPCWARTCADSALRGGNTSGAIVTGLQRGPTRETSAPEAAAVRGRHAGGGTPRRAAALRASSISLNSTGRRGRYRPEVPWTATTPG